MSISNPTIIVGTANQVLANGTFGVIQAGEVTLTLTQALGPTSSPTFSSLTLSGLTPNSFLYSGTGGLLTTTPAPTNGQLLIGSTGVAPVLATITAGTGISVTNGPGTITIANTGVISFSAGSTGFTPNTPTTGVVTLGGTLNSTSGGTGTTTAPTAGQIMVGTSGGTYVPATITTGTGISTTPGSGTLQINNTGVTSFSAGLTGFTPSVTTTGAVTLAGTLIVSNGGTGDTTFTTYGIVFGNGISPLQATAAGATGQVLTGNTGSPPTWSTLSTIGVTSISFGTTGLTPNVATTGAVIVAGTLSVGSGGTGDTAFTSNGVLYGNGSASPLGVTAAGTTGQVLTGNTGSPPTWSTLSGAAVTSFQTSLSGLFPNTATTGVVTLAGTLNVSSGGTGDTTFTMNGVLYGNGTSSLATTAAGINGQVLIGNTGSPPTWSTLTGVVVTSITGTANQILADATSGIPEVGAVTLTIPTTFIAPGSVQVTTSFQVSATNSISGAGATQGTATVLTTDYNVVTTTNAGTGVVLPAGLAGRQVVVVNRGVNPLLVYPALGAAIDGLAVNIPVSVPAGQTYIIEAISGTQWYTNVPTYAAGAGISFTDTNGVLTYSNTGVLSFSAGTTGLTPSIATTGAVTLGGILNPANGGTGIANNNSSTLTISGSFPLTLTLTGPTSVTLPTSGTLATVGNTVASFQTSLSGLSPSVATTGAVTLSGTLNATSGGTGTATAPTSGQVLVGTSGGEYVPFTITTGTGISVLNGSGTLQINNTGVTSIGFGTTGLTPSAATTGAITVAGTLVVGNGGTGDTTFTTNGVLFGNAAAALGVTAAGTTGQVLVGNTGSAPTWSTLTGISVTSITGTANEIAANGVFTTQTGAVTLTIPTTFIAPGSIEATTTVQIDNNTAKTFLYSDANKQVASTAAPTNGQLLIGSTGNIPVVSTLTAGTGITITNAAGSITIAQTSGSDVTSITGTANEITASASTGAVTLSTPAVFIAPGSIASTSTITAAIGLTLTYGTVDSFLYVGAAGAVISTAAATNGQILIGSTGSVPVANTITAGTGITVTNGAGTITIAQTAGSDVTSISFGTTGLTPSTATTGAVTVAGTLAIGSGGTGQTAKQAAFDALSPLGTAGDTLYYNGTHNVALAVGLANQILTIVSGEPAWVYPTMAVNPLTAVTTYTLALTDQGGEVYITDASFTTVTVPANGSVAFPKGSAVTIINDSGASISIAITTDTMQLAGGTSTGTRTLVNGGVATVNKVATTKWFISGVGLT